MTTPDYCRCLRPVPAVNAPELCGPCGKRIAPGGQTSVKMKPDDFALRQWRTLCRMVKDMQERYEGLSLE